MKDKSLCLLFLLPGIALTGALVAYPVSVVIMTSFQHKLIFSTKALFTGFDNYCSILKNPYFWTSILNTLIWTFGCLFLQFIWGLAVALVMNRTFPFRNVARALVAVPYIVPIVVSMLVFRFMLNDAVGIVNYFLIRIGLIKNPISFFASPRLAMLGVILAGSWARMPFVMITILAGLQSIPPQLYEAAKIDGAGALQAFYHVTLPLLKPVIIIVLLIRTIWNFQTFDIIFLLTKGGPLMSTTTLPVFLYNQAFVGYDLGRASSAAVFMLLILLLVMFFYMRTFERRGSV